MSKGKENPRAMELRVLRDLLGHRDFRPYQEECVRCLLKGDDLLAILPTGGGKSAIYQIPALVFHAERRERRCLVVSPLVSLISDQTDSLNRKLCVSPEGEVVRKDHDRATGEAVAGRLGDASTPFIFITPERLRTSPEAVGLLSLSLIVVDEAHCISGHGLSFREDYRDLSHLRQLHPFVPICALTATASATVRADIVSILGLRSGHSIVRAPIDRSNLRLTVAFRKTLRDDIGDIALHLGQRQGIVYFQTRDEVEKGAEALKSRGIDIAPYHAGLAPELRRSVQDRFVSGDLRCIAATIAFGMGIDVPGIRCVVHYGLPGTLENYLQEIGRAGRDGSPAECVLYWSSADASARGRAGKENIDPSLAARGLRAMLDFAQSPSCLRRRLAQYFEDDDATSTCSARGGEACSKCRDDGCRFFVDYGMESRCLLRTVGLVRVGVVKQIDYHCGKSGKSTEELRKRHADKLFGSGANRSLLFWKSLHEHLRGSGHIHSNEHGACFLTDCGREALENDDPIVLPEILIGNISLGATKRPLQDETPSKKSAGPSPETDGASDGRLRSALIALRTAEAMSKGCRSFMVFSDRVLQGIVSAKPNSAAALLDVAGIGPATESAYGEKILRIVRDNG
jgi:ATP-dependent DNA helicase RecQ